MSKTDEKVIKKYYKKIKNYLKISSVDKKRSEYILNSLLEHSNTYFQENPNASFDDFQNEYGSPEDIINSVIENENYDSLVKKYNISKLKKVILITVLLLIVFAVGIEILLTVKSYFDVQNSIIIYENSVIE